MDVIYSEQSSSNRVGYPESDEPVSPFLSHETPLRGSKGVQENSLEDAGPWLLVCHLLELLAKLLH